MFKNYLKIGLRALVKQKIYSFINIIGLSVGIASVAMILLHVEDEFSYDQFHVKKDELYKVSLERKYPNHSTFYDIIPHSYMEVMVQDYPEVVAGTRIADFTGGGQFTVMMTYIDENNNKKAFEESRFLAADSNFFDMFSIEILKGDKENALRGANKTVITEETAKKYFGDEDPIGKTISSPFAEFQVTAVCANIPDNSHFDFDFLASILSGGPFFQQPNFMGFSAHTYLELAPGADAKALEAKFPAMVDKYAGPQVEQSLNLSYADYVKAGNGYRYIMRPLTSVHLDPTNYEAKMKPGGNLTYVYIFISISIMIMIIACINFMNLATARSAERAKEVGIRKTMGSYRSQLISQFLTESIVISLVSMMFAFLIIYLALPSFNTLAQKNLSLSLTGSMIVPIMFVFAMIVGLLAGSYPAFVISGYNPVSVLKGKLLSSTKGSWLRNGLVIFQFFVSIVLIVGTLGVQRQMEFMRNKSLGFDKDQIVYVTGAGVLGPSFDAFVNEIERIPGVESAAGGGSIPGLFTFGAQFTKEGSTEPLTTKSFNMSDDFAETMGFEIVEGRDFSKDFDDSLSLMLNEVAVETFGLDDPIGSRLTVAGVGAGGVNQVFTVIGVVKDYHFQSLRDEITPLAIFSAENNGQAANFLVAIRAEGRNLSDVVPQVENLWKTLVQNDEPFKYEFLDQSLEAQYNDEKRSGELFGIFAGLAIIIACVGLFGLAAYTAGLRTKEIGVRKVMGASVIQVVVMLSIEFTKLIAIAFILAVPLAWWGMDTWLSGFYYRTSLGVGIFLIAGGSALLISWLTVSYQSIKAAVVNPVKSLRSE